MYICLCHGITESEIRRCAAEGAATLPDLERCLGVGTNCGRCRETAAVLLAQHDPAPLCAQPA